MTIEQIVDIPADRRIFLDLPFASAGRARITVTVTPEAVSLERAAALMAAEYADDPELTAFCALDGEDFKEHVI